MSAEKKRSNGASLEICSDNFPEEPYTTFTSLPGLVFLKFAITESKANLRSDAAAIVISLGSDFFKDMIGTTSISKAMNLVPFIGLKLKFVKINGVEVILLWQFRCTMKNAS